MIPMADDKREIDYISGPDDEHPARRMFFVVAGAAVVTRIEAYHEYGNGDYGMTWFAVWAGDRLVARVNSAYIESVGYKGGE